MIAVGVDTHKERHHAVALDHLGQILTELVFMASAAGYRELQDWVEALAGTEELVFAIEGAGSWGAGLCEHLQHAGHRVLEVERPRRRDRRAGKSDRIDAIAAAKRVLTDDTVSTPRGRGILTAIRALLIARRSAVAAAAKLLACDPTRFKSEAAFARCNGTAPIPASSGKTVRYRLNPGGDRQANNAIHTIAIIRAKH
jgi:transposase